VTVVIASIAGTAGDGKISLALAGAALLAVLLTRGRGIGLGFAVVLCIVIAASVGYDIVHIEHVAVHTTLLGHRVFSPAWGLYATLIGATVAIVGFIAPANRQLRVAVTLLAIPWEWFDRDDSRHHRGDDYCRYNDIEPRCAVERSDYGIASDKLRPGRLRGRGCRRGTVRVCTRRARATPAENDTVHTHRWLPRAFHR
jgi:hypothetical protein